MAWMFANIAGKNRYPDITTERKTLANVSSLKLLERIAPKNDNAKKSSTTGKIAAIISMVASGQAAPEEIYTHPHRSVIYRSVGDQPVVEVDTDVVSLDPGDRLIVCCDGLWEMIRDEGIEDVMLQEADPQAASELLVQHANVAGGDDNISIIVVQVEPVG